MEKRIIGVTGGVGAGKSRVLKILAGDFGAHVIQADEVAKALMEPGQECYRRVVEYLGDSILAEDGTIDRQAMAVERLKTIDMTPAGGGDAQDWVGAWLDGFDQALDLCRALETALDADTGKELSGDAR